MERLIPTEIFTRFAATDGREVEVQIPLPATPGLSRIRELVITFGPETKGKPIDLTITHLAVSPISPAGGLRRLTTSNRSSSPPTLLVPTKTRNSPGSTTNLSSRL